MSHPFSKFTLFWYGISGHDDLVQQGLATQGETLGFSGAPDDQGQIRLNNISELNVGVNPSGALPSNLFNAVQQATGAR